jgi:hypothetical protein
MVGAGKDCGCGGKHVLNRAAVFSYQIMKELWKIHPTLAGRKGLWSGVLRVTMRDLVVMNPPFGLIIQQSEHPPILVVINM